MAEVPEHEIRENILECQEGKTKEFKQIWINSPSFSLWVFYKITTVVHLNLYTKNISDH